MKTIKYNFNWGPLWVKIDKHCLVELSFSELENAKVGRHSDDLYKQLTAYFNGDLQKFNIRLAPQGTSFQHRVWDQLMKIGYGKTVSYSDIAEAIDSPKAIRAVGTAIGKNPIPIIIPCHRVIHKDGSLGGYSGGLQFKKMLLEVEGVE